MKYLLLFLTFLLGAYIQMCIDRGDIDRNNKYFEKEVRLDKELRSCVSEQGLAKYVVDLVSDCMNIKGYMPRGKYGGSWTGK